MDRPRSPGQRAGLTRDRVLAAAYDVLAEQGAAKGIAALTMRAVAQRLDVAPNALYSHVANKTELLDGVLDGLLARVEVPTADGDPVEALHQLMSSAHATLLDHPDLVPGFLLRQGARGPHAQRLGEVVLALLERAGVTGPEAREALRVLIVYTIGFAAFTARGPAGTGAVPAGELEGNFDSGLRWLLGGIVAGEDRARATGRPERSAPDPVAAAGTVSDLIDDQGR